MFTKLPLVLLATAGLASISTAYSPHHEHARSINILPRQFGGGGGRLAGGNRNGGGNGGNNGGNGGNNGGNGGNNGGNGGGNGGNNGGNAGGNAELQLDPANVQDASKATGQNGGGTADGQADSATDNANFINFCTGKTLTNGAQVQGGSCNGIVMGDIPAQSNMVSSIIVSPAPGEDVAADTAFDITVQVANLEAGSFTNPQNTYYAAPQALKGGNIVGHTHVTVQDLGNSLTPNQAPDATKFVFFKGINDAGNGNGLLKASVDQGLPAGNYRVCTMSSASNHQPVLMPVAQRGAQDDCTKFTVGKGGGNAGGNAGGNTGNNGGNAGNGGNATGGGQGQGGQGQGGQGGGRRRGGRRGGRRRGGRFGGGFRNGR